MEKKEQITQTNVIQDLDKVFADLTTAWAQNNVSDAYREELSELLSKAYKVAVRVQH